jgi:hypothetical protein
MRAVAVLGGNENERSQGFQIGHGDSGGRALIGPSFTSSVMIFIDSEAAPC